MFAHFNTSLCLCHSSSKHLMSPPATFDYYGYRKSMRKEVLGLASHSVPQLTSVAHNVRGKLLMLRFLYVHNVSYFVIILLLSLFTTSVTFFNMFLSWLDYYRMGCNLNRRWYATSICLKIMQQHIWRASQRLKGCIHMCVRVRARIPC